MENLFYIYTIIFRLLVSCCLVAWSPHHLVTALPARFIVCSHAWAPGVTRRSVLDIAEGWSASENPLASSEGPLTVSERWVTMGELLQAQAEGRVGE